MLNDGGPNGMEFKDIERTTTQDNYWMEIKSKSKSRVKKVQGLKTQYVNDGGPNEKEFKVIERTTIQD